MQKLKITKPSFGKQEVIFPVVGKVQIDSENSFEVEDDVDANHLKEVLEGSNIFIEIPETEAEGGEGSDAAEPVDSADTEGNPEEEEDAEEETDNSEEDKPSREEIIEVINKLTKKEMLEYIKTEMPDTISMQKAGPLGAEKLRTLIISSL